MSETLYRKYRPHTFTDVVGQDTIVDSLKASISQKKLAHAYMFVGSRGIGKTSIARIFAREIGTQDSDLYEIDAASNRGIDDIREIRDGVHSLPFESPYKVYLIDEVHMLTKEAWNALLKTLEEPPSHVIFILATTETEKIPETIISRCQVFTFKKPTARILADVILHTAEKEGFTIEEQAAELIALSADGSFRDAHGILQKILSASDVESEKGKKQKISIDSVSELIGVPQKKIVFDFIEAVATKNIEAGSMLLEHMEEKQIQYPLFLFLAVDAVRAILLYAHAPQSFKTLYAHLSEDDVEEVGRLAGLKKGEKKAFTAELLLGLIESADVVGRSVYPRARLELLLM